MVQFNPVSYTVGEGEQVSLVAVLNIEADRPVMVDFATKDDSATGNDAQTEKNPSPHEFTLHCPVYAAPGDYAALTTTITFPTGETQVQILVGTQQDEMAELAENFVAVLTNPSQGLLIGSQDEATVTIMDDEGM